MSGAGEKNHLIYEKYFLNIVKTINEQITKKCPDSVMVNMFAWANDRVPELYAQERLLDAEMNALWEDVLPPTPLQRGTVSSPAQEGGEGFVAFKSKVLAWGRIVLQIYKEFVADRHLEKHE